MISNSNSFELNLTPKFGFCNDVKVDNDPMRKIIWMVPHVITHKGNAEIITWRCNWGNICKSGCLYAMAIKQTERIKDTQEKLPEAELAYTLKNIGVINS